MKHRKLSCLLKVLHHFGIATALQLHHSTHVPYNSVLSTLARLEKRRCVKRIGHLKVEKSDPHRGLYYMFRATKESNRILNRTCTRLNAIDKKQLLTYQCGRNIAHFSSGISFPFHRVAVTYSASKLLYLVRQRILMPREKLYFAGERYFRNVLGWWSGRGPQPKTENIRLASVPDAMIAIDMRACRIEVELAAHRGGYYSEKFRLIQPISWPTIIIRYGYGSNADIIKRLPEGTNVLVVSWQDEDAVERLINWMNRFLR